MQWGKPKLSGEQEQIRSFLLAIPLFKQISSRSQAFTAFVRNISLQHFTREETIYRPGISTSSVYIVQRGEVRVVLKNADADTEKLVAVHGRGSIFGEVSLLSGEAHSSQAICTVASEILVVPGKDLLRLLKEEPAMGEALSQLLSRRLNHNIRATLQSPSRIFTIVYPENPQRGSLIANRIASILSQSNPEQVLHVTCNSRSPRPQGSSIKLTAILDRLSGMDTASMHHIFRNPRDGLHSVDATEFWSRYQDSRYQGETLHTVLQHLKKYYSVVLINLEADEGIQRMGELFENSDRLAIIRSMNQDLQDRYRQNWERTLEAFGRSRSSTEKLITATDEVSPKQARLTEILALDPVIADSLSRYRSHIRLRSTGPDSLVLENDARLTESLEHLSRRLSGASRGIALGGGGARSIAHIGVMEVLEQEGIEIDAIAGSSMGAVVGAAFAMGWKATEVARILSEAIPGRNAILDKNLPVVSFFRGKKIESLLYRVFGDTRFEDLEKPFYCNASDLYSGKSIVFDSGPVHTALRASISIPGFFPPVESRDQSLVDGSVLDSIPSSILKAHDYSRVIGVSVTPQIERPRTSVEHHHGRNLFDNLFQYFSMPPILRIFTRAMSVQNVALIEHGAKNVDFLLRPEIEAFDLFDFHRYEELIAAGREAAIANLTEIRDILNRQSLDDRLQ